MTFPKKLYCLCGTSNLGWRELIFGQKRHKVQVKQNQTC